MSRGGAAVDAPDGGRATGEVRRSFVLRGFASAGGAVATLASTVIAVRSLGAAEATVFLSVLAALMIGPMVGRLGLGYNVVRLLAGEDDEDRFARSAGEHVRTASTLSVLTAGVVALVATLGIAGAPDRPAVTALVVVLVVAETVRLTYSDLLAARGAVGWSVATMHHTRSVVVVVVLLALVLVDPSPSLLDLLTAYATVSVGLLALAMVRLRGSVALRGPLPLRTLRALLAAGAMLFTLDLSVYLVGRGNVWLASAAFPPEAAAGFSTASTLAYQVTIFQGLASLAVTPVAARMWARGERDAAGRLLAAIATVTTAVAGLIVVGAVLLGAPVLGLLYGEGLRPAGGLLAVLAVGGLAQTAFGPNVTLLVVSGHLRRAAVWTSVTLALVVAVAVPAALLGGPLALAVASAGAMTAVSAAQYVASRGILARTPRPSGHVVAAWRVLRGPAAAGAR